jgi:outer membrane protein TolC
VSRRLLSVKSITIALCAGLLHTVSAAQALEPLDEFLIAADTHALDVREAGATAGQRGAELNQARTRFVPVLSATGREIYNQKENQAVLPTGRATFVPHHQRDLVLQARLPLIDVASWRQVGASKAASRSADENLSATRLNVRRTTVQRYYDVVAAEALADAARRTVQASEHNLAWVRSRVAAGMASELDQRRAEAEVERNRQILADADYQRAITRRQLESLTGKTPATGAPQLLVALDPEPPLPAFAEGTGGLPDVVSAREAAVAAQRRIGAARAVLLPTLDGLGTQTFTNAAGFGPKVFYAVGVTATWRLDASAVPALAAEKQRAVAAQVQAERAERAAFDAIHQAWHDVTRQIEKSRASRAEASSAQLAVRMVKDRYAVGTATFLDVVLAERDELRAEANRIDADAGLCSARAELRLLSGRAFDPRLCGVAP